MAKSVTKEEAKPIGVDATGYEVLTKAVRDLLNQYPGLQGREIRFEQLDADSGIAFSADSGALVMLEKRSITDHITQLCQFPFFVVYRAANTRDVQKVNVQTFLDGLGKWLCHEEPGAVYPKLTDGRKITRITRSNSYGLTPNENGVQDWLLPVTVQYNNEFDLW